MNFVVIVQPVIESAGGAVGQQRSKNVARVIVGCSASTIVGKRSKRAERREFDCKQLSAA